MVPVDPAFAEIEHKFLVADNFDEQGFKDSVRGVMQGAEVESAVVDTYFVTASSKGYLYRHRFDDKIQDFSIKSVEKDSESRLEINLKLSQLSGSQLHFVRGFLSPLNILFEGSINKKLWAIEGAECEVVYYMADYRGVTIRCIEVESKIADSSQSLEVLEKYEKLLGLDSQNRETRSIFELLLRPELPKSVKNLMGWH